MQLNLDLAQRYEVPGRQEQNVSTKCISPLVKSKGGEQLGQQFKQFKNAG